MNKGAKTKTDTWSKSCHLWGYELLSFLPVPPVIAVFGVNYIASSNQVRGNLILAGLGASLGWGAGGVTTLVLAFDNDMNPKPCNFLCTAIIYAPVFIVAPML